MQALCGQVHALCALDFSAFVSCSFVQAVGDCNIDAVEREERGENANIYIEISISQHTTSFASWLNCCDAADQQQSSRAAAGL